LDNDGNYLLPIDFLSIEDCPDNRDRIVQSAYALNNLLSQLERTRNRANVIVMDAYRNSTLPSITRSAGNSRGLSVVSSTPPDIIIIYSTAVGSTATDSQPERRNNPFAEAFLKHIAKPDPIALVMAGITAETLSLTGNSQRQYLSSSIANRSHSLNSNALVFMTDNTTGTIQVSSISTDAISIDNQDTRVTVKVCSSAAIQNVFSSITKVSISTPDGWLFSQEINGDADKTVLIAFSHINPHGFTVGTSGVGLSITGYTGSDASVIVPESINGASVISISDSAFWH
jgi:hypothetical protein